MCTLIVIHRSVPGRPLIVAANRDEYYDRPAEGPSLRRNGQGYMVAPRDVRAGGTWLGVNEHGVFAALTNLRNPNPLGPDLNRSSRGKVVTRALEAASADEAAEVLGALGEGVYNPFNCYVADAQRAHLVVYSEAPRVVRLAPGVHVIGNTDASREAAPKMSRIEQQATRVAAAGGDEVLRSLAAICREHGSGGAPLDDTCVHVGGTYGTRSSILLELPELGDARTAKGRVAGVTPVSGERASGVETKMSIGGRLLYADGPPCSNEYEDFTPLLQELRQAPGDLATGILARKAS